MWDVLLHELADFVWWGEWIDLSGMRSRVADCGDHKLYVSVMSVIMFLLETASTSIFLSYYLEFYGKYVLKIRQCFTFNTWG